MTEREKIESEIKYNKDCIEIINDEIETKTDDLKNYTSALVNLYDKLIMLQSDEIADLKDIH